MATPSVPKFMLEMHKPIAIPLGGVRVDSVHGAREFLKNMKSFEFKDEAPDLDQVQKIEMQTKDTIICFVLKATGQTLYCSTDHDYDYFYIARSIAALKKALENPYDVARGQLATSHTGIIIASARGEILDNGPAMANNAATRKRHRHNEISAVGTDEPPAQIPRIRGQGNEDPDEPEDLDADTANNNNTGEDVVQNAEATANGVENANEPQTTLPGPSDVDLLDALADTPNNDHLSNPPPGAILEALQNALDCAKTHIMMTHERMATMIHPPPPRTFEREFEDAFKRGYDEATDKKIYMLKLMRFQAELFEKYDS